MSIKAKINLLGETEFTFETEADYRIWLKVGKERFTQAPASSQGGGEPSMHDRLVRFSENASAKQDTLLEALYKTKAGLTDVELRMAVGAKSNQALGGLIGGIAKTAKPFGLAVAHIISKTTRGAHYYYSLTSEMREVLREAESSQ